MARICIFVACSETDLSLSNKFSSADFLSLHTILRRLSCKGFILSFECGCETSTQLGNN